MNWYKKITATSKKIISFDFDGTLTKPVYDEENEMWISNEPNFEIIDKMNDLYEKGYKIIIVTSRTDSGMDEVRHFAEKYRLPISAIYNTNGELKGPMLDSLGVIKHFDDSQYEIGSAKEYNVNTERVTRPLDIENETDRQEN